MTPKRIAGLAWIGMVALVLSGCAGKDGAMGRRPKQRRAPSIGVTDSPVTPKTRYAAARLFESTRNFDKAIEQYRKTVEAEPRFVEAHHRLGVLLSNAGRFTEAETHLRKAVALKPDSDALRNNLAFVLILQKRWADAETMLRELLRRDPGFVNARTNLGMVLAAQGRFEECYATYRMVMPEADALYNLGMAYRAHRDFNAARRTFEHVLAVDPDFQAARVRIERMDRALASVERRAKIRNELFDSAEPDATAAAAFGGPVTPIKPQNDAAPQDDSPTARPAPQDLLVDRADATGTEPGVASEPDAHRPVGASVFAKPADEPAGRETTTPETSLTSMTAETNLTPPPEPARSAAGDCAGEGSRVSSDAESGTLTEPEPEPKTAIDIALASDREIAEKAQKLRECEPAGSVWSPVFIRPGDMDGDLKVDDRDYEMISRCFGAGGADLPQSPCVHGDLNDDGQVDLTDFGLFQRLLEVQ